MRKPLCLLAIVIGALSYAHLNAQDQVRSGPPPAIRELVEATMKAINANSTEWEAFARERFSTAFLEKSTPDSRRQMHERLRADFGTVTLERAMWQGPDAPLELSITGSTGAVGVVGLEIAEASPPRISNLTVDRGKRERGAGPVVDGVPPPPVNSTMSVDELNQALHRYFSDLTTRDAFSGVALVAKGGVPVFLNAYGMADRANKIPNSIRTRFNIGSINKTFTQVAIGQLIRDGKLAPTDTIGKILPDYPQEISKSATIEQLLSHRAGIADFFGPEFNRADKQQFRGNADYFRFVGAQPPAFAPGARNQYCNGCYITLGAIIERVSGMPYERYVDEQVFRRAEMTSTGYPRTDQPAADIAIGYTRRGSDGTLQSNVAMHGLTGSAAGGGYSTALDLLTYVKAVRAGRFPSADPDFGIAGGAPGVSAVVEAEGDWTVIVITNQDPPTGERIGVALIRALRAKN